MSFFLKKRTNRTKITKRKKPKQKSDQASKKPSTSQVDLDISSESEPEEDERKPGDGDEIHDDEELDETPQEKKLRLAKKYLEEIEREEKERLESQEIEKSLLGDRLEQEDPQVRERLKDIADELEHVTSSEGFRLLKNGHRLSVTCLCMTSDCKYIFSGGKEGSIIKWDFETGRKLHVVPAEKKRPTDEEDEKRVGHCRPVSAIAVSTSGKFLASVDGGKDIRIWNTENLSLIHKFDGHRSAVTGLVFRRSTHTLYSCSHDRSVKVWDVDELTYVECLFGHFEPITAIDSLFRERAITAGGRDTTIRLWKIPEESQLVFHAGDQSIDCVKFLNEQYFISAGEDGCVSLWSILKKKPLHVVKDAHGIDKSSCLGNWITSVATLVNSNIFASGSCDGLVRLWKITRMKQIEPLFTIPAVGFVNGMQFSSKGDFLVVGVGQEHRLGRWWKIKEARNQIIIIPLKRKE